MWCSESCYFHNRHQKLSEISNILHNDRRHRPPVRLQNPAAVEQFRIIEVKLLPAILYDHPRYEDYSKNAAPHFPLRKSEIRVDSDRMELLPLNVLDSHRQSTSCCNTSASELRSQTLNHVETLEAGVHTIRSLRKNSSQNVRWIPKPKPSR